MKSKHFPFFVAGVLLAALTAAALLGHPDALPILLAVGPMGMAFPPGFVEDPLGRLAAAGPYNSASKLSPQDGANEELPDVPYEELGRRVASHRKLMNNMRTDAANEDRELTARELDRLEEQGESLAIYEAEMESRPEHHQTRAQAAQAKTGPSGTGRKSSHDAGEKPAVGPASEWRDTEGKPVLCLAPAQSLASTMIRAKTRSTGHREDAALPSAGDVICAMIDGQWERRGIDMKNAMSEGIGGDGGFFVQPMVSAQIIDLARAASVVIQAGAQTIPMSTNALDLVKVARDPTISMVPENTTIPRSVANFATMSLRAVKFATVIEISRELVEDAPNARTEVERLLAIAMANAIDDAALFGTQSPIGVFTAAGVQELAVTGGAPNFDYDDILEAISKIEGVNGKPNAAVYNSLRKKNLAQLKDTTGNYLAPPADVAALNRLVSNKLGNAQALVGDFRQMLIGVRVGVQIEVAANAGAAFDSDQVHIKVRWRGDVGFAHEDHFVRLSGIA